MSRHTFYIIRRAGDWYEVFAIPVSTRYMPERHVAAFRTLIEAENYIVAFEEI